MAAAAEALGISRPAVAKRIRNLEALANTELLRRDGRGVALTDAGATLLADARGLLAERDALVVSITRIRGEEQPAIDGLRGILGHASASERAAQRPEARLAETERVLDLVLSSSGTGFVISDPDSGELHVANDAFCLFCGHSREALGGDLEQATVEHGPTWGEMLRALRRDGELLARRIACRRADGTLRVARVSAHYILLGGVEQVLWRVEDVIDQDFVLEY